MPSEAVRPVAPRDLAFTPRRLHPSSIVLGVDLRRVVQGAVPALVLLASTDRLAPAVSLGGLLLAAAATYRLLAWQRFTYGFDGAVVHIEQGVVNRSRRAVDAARVQQVELDQPIVQRLLGVATLRLETAGDTSEAEVSLRVVAVDDARALRAAVRAARASLAPATGDGERLPPPPPARRRVVAVPLTHVALAAVTGSRLLVVPAVAVGVLEWAGNLGTDLDPTALLGGLAAGAAAAIALVAVVLTLATGAVVGMLRDGDFSVERAGDDLHVRRGLLSTREAVVPLARIQLVEVRRSWVRRLLRVAAVELHSAGGSEDAERRVVIPLVPDAQVSRLLPELLPGAGAEPPLRPHPRAGRLRAVWRPLRVALPVSVAAAVVWWPVGLAAGALLVPAAVVLGVAAHRQLGHARTTALVAARSGMLSVTTQLAPVVKIQGVTRSSTPFQRRLGLATTTAHVAGTAPRVRIVDAADADTRELHADLALASARVGR